MAPDLNTLPVSLRPGENSQPASLSTSRRTSQVMGPPPAASASVTNNPSSNTHRNSVILGGEQAGLPLRHPRPLTAAELYLECEKEQEAVVNRLTRELTALRAQSASVASNASQSSTSTSASLLPVDISDPNPTHQITGSTHPIPSRRHRSSSSVSNRSIQHPPSNAQTTNSAATSAPSHGASGNITSPPLGGISQASADRAAAAGSTTLSRQPSTSALSASASARQSLDLARHPHRPSISREHSLVSQHTNASTSAQAGSHPLPSPGSAPSPGLAAAMQHIADATAYRTEMEIVRAENEALRQRVRALERALRAAGQSSSTPSHQQGRRRRGSSQSEVSALGARPSRENLEASASSSARVSMLSPGPSATASVGGVAAWAANDGGIGGVAGPRERSESQSTTASSRRGMGVGGDDDVRVGESASSIGVGRGV